MQQQRIEFFRDLRLLPEPQRAALNIVRQVESARMAMRVSLQGHKHEAVAARLKISKGYLSRIVNEKQPMPEWFEEAFCLATQSWLLRQYLALQCALTESEDRTDWLERKLASELRSAAA